MSDQPLAPLPPEIDMLLSLERDAYGEEQALKRAVLSHVELSVALRGPSGGGSAPPSTSGAGSGGGATGVVRPASKVLGAAATGAFVVGALVGGVGGRALSRSAVVPAAVPVVPVVAASVEVAPQAVAASIPDPSDASRDTVSAPRLVPSAEERARRAEAHEGGNDLVREREVIDAARAALARGRSADALRGTARHAERWPRGHLAEEREVIAIQALAGLGRRVEASLRAAAFKRAFPSSMLIPAVDVALSTPSTP